MNMDNVGNKYSTSSLDSRPIACPYNPTNDELPVHAMLSKYPTNAAVPVTGPL
jgi:hypothetical protein